jgi:hypothetical protein
LVESENDQRERGDSAVRFSEHGVCGDHGKFMDRV